jgi:hypothetical protein
VTFTPKRDPALSPVFSAPPTTEATCSRRAVTVIFTSVESTLAALKKGATLASRLGSHVTLLVPEVVPYPQPLTTSLAQQDLSEKRFGELLKDSSVDATVQIFLCRDQLEAVNALPNPGSIVVVGGPKRWWATDEKHLADMLCGAGHEVIFEETD